MSQCANLLMASSTMPAQTIITLSNYHIIKLFRHGKSSIKEREGKRPEGRR